MGVIIGGYENRFFLMPAARVEVITHDKLTALSRLIDRLGQGGRGTAAGSQDHIDGHGLITHISKLVLGLDEFVLWSNLKPLFKLVPTKLGLAC